LNDCYFLIALAKGHASTQPEFHKRRPGPPVAPKKPKSNTYPSTIASVADERAMPVTSPTSASSSVPTYPSAEAAVASGKQSSITSISTVYLSQKKRAYRPITT